MMNRQQFTLTIHGLHLDELISFGQLAEELQKPYYVANEDEPTEIRPPLFGASAEEARLAQNEQQRLSKTVQAEAVVPTKKRATVIGRKVKWPQETVLRAGGTGPSNPDCRPGKVHQALREMTRDLGAPITRQDLTDHCVVNLDLGSPGAVSGAITTLLQKGYIYGDAPQALH